jgi:uncharacterized protein (TIGR02453 family)
MSASFQGFQPQAVQFFRDLAQNNNKTWFDAHKKDYQTLIQQPALVFIEALGERLMTLSPGMTYDTRANGAGSLMRIYRDTRFSADKTPYKTNLGIVFWEGEGKKMENPGVYFGLAVDEGARLFTGHYQFPPPFLKAYREAVGGEKLGRELQEAIAALSASGRTVEGDQYKRVPTGFSADHPRADLLRYKGLYTVTLPIDPAVVASPKLVDVCLRHASEAMPLHRWLLKVNALI